MKFKLLVSDFDGTLTEDHSSIVTTKVQEKLKLIQDENIHIAIATGRHPNFIKKN